MSATSRMIDERPVDEDAVSACTLWDLDTVQLTNQMRELRLSKTCHMKSKNN